MDIDFVLVQMFLKMLESGALKGVANSVFGGDPVMSTFHHEMATYFSGLKYLFLLFIFHWWGDHSITLISLIHNLRDGVLFLFLLLFDRYCSHLRVSMCLSFHDRNLS